MQISLITLIKGSVKNYHRQTWSEANMLLRILEIYSQLQKIHVISSPYPHTAQICNWSNSCGKLTAYEQKNIFSLSFYFLAAICLTV